MPRLLICCSLLVLPTAVSGQEGSIAYTHSVRIELELPEEIRARLEAMGRGGGPGRAGLVPTERVTEEILLFDATESLMKPVPPAEGELEGRRGRAGFGERDSEVEARAAGLMARLRMASSARADRETLVETHTRYDEGTVTERREFLGRTFLIRDTRPPYAWKLTGEQAEFLGYLVQKATTVKDSTSIEAWFTPEIPLQGGPGVFGGLPGMILVVSVDEGREQYTATAVSLADVEEGVIVRPEDGEAVTREEYESIVAEKLEELRMTRGRIRR